jgi:outer membrane protein insertion porin family
VAPGEVFDMVKVKRSKQKLEGLSYFDRVEAQPEPILDIKGSRNLVIAVNEKNTGNIAVGAGFSTVDSLVGFVEVTQGNFDLFNPPWFTGGGQRMRLRLAIGTERRDYVLNFVEPWFLGRKLALSTDLYYRDLDFVSLNELYSERIAGVRVGLTRELTRIWNFPMIGGISYTFENVNLDLNSGLHSTPIYTTNGTMIVTNPPNVSEEIARQDGNYWISRFGSSLAYDTRGAGFLPEKGQRTELRGDIAGGPLGGTVDDYRLEARTSWYFRGFTKGHVLEVGARVGVIEHYNDTAEVPLFDRWFLGGLDTLRGYEYRDVGPKDEFNEPLGGGTYWFGTIEYSIPIVERVRLAAFYDIGMVYPKAYSFEPQKRSDGFTTGRFNDNWGIGLRLFLPIGPLRLDYGIPISDDPSNGSSGRFQFSAGYTRDF